MADIIEFTSCGGAEESADRNPFDIDPLQTYGAKMADTLLCVQDSLRDLAIRHPDLCADPKFADVLDGLEHILPVPPEDD